VKGFSELGFTVIAGATDSWIVAEGSRRALASIDEPAG
jgi:hypothetical protein